MRFKKYLNEISVKDALKLRDKLLKSKEIYMDKKGMFVCKKCKETFKSPKLATVHYINIHTKDVIESVNEAPLQTKGWDEDSVKKFEKTIGKKADEHGFFDACVARMKGKEGFDEQKAKGFCAAIKDKKYDSTYWRGKSKSKKEIKKDVKEHPYKK